MAPSVRTVVFRGFLQPQHLLAAGEATSDDGSEESDAKDLTGLGCQDPALQAVRSTVWQRLILGAASVAGWVGGLVTLLRKSSTKETFSWPHPGRPRGQEEGVARRRVLVILPSSVDELHLGGRQKRKIYRSSFSQAQRTQP
eukprot:Skav210614  [mRNA]  locus=scaffold234:286019:288392:+ [translate_table: standard]